MHKELFLDNLPLLNPGGKNKKYDWQEIIKKKIPIHFVYDTIEGDIYTLEEYRDKKEIKIYIKDYTDGTIIKKGDLVRCRLAAVLNLFSKEYKYNIGDLVKTKYGEVTIVEQCRIKENHLNQPIFVRGYKIYCKKHDYTNTISEEKLKIGIGCPLCSGSKTFLEEGINDIATTDPELIKYFVNKDEAKKFSRGSLKYVEMQCPDCGYKTTYPIKALIRYPFPCACSDNINYPNRFMMNILLQIGANFKAEVTKKTFEWIPDFYRYDFYVKKDNNQLFIEMDGHYHFNNFAYTGKTLNWKKALDNEKNKLAMNHGIPIIRIQCDYPSLEKRHEYIVQNILSSPLTSLFDFSKVDFMDAERKSLTSTIKNISSDYSNGETSTSNLAKKYNINDSTVRKYLTIASNASLCKYNNE